MKKIIYFLAVLVLTMLPTVSVLADYDMMGPSTGYGCGMMAGMGFWNAHLFGLLYFLILSFIFSLIFWVVYKWLIKK